MTDTRQALLPCPFCGNSKGLAVANENPQDLSGGYFIACPSCDASTGLRFACGEDPIPLLIEQWNRRAALSAQSVAGAVALTDNQLEPVLEAWFVTDGTFYERMRAALSAQPVAGAVATEAQLNSACMSYRHDFGLMTPDEQERLRWSAKEWLHAWRKEFAQAAPAPEPVRECADNDSPWLICKKCAAAGQCEKAAPAPEQNAQAGWKLVPVEPTWDMQMAASSAYREPRDGHYTARMECAANAYRAMLAASPQPEPSAQGEPVAWRPGDPIYDDAYVRGVAVGFAEDDSRRTTLLRIADRIEALASAPSTPPHAVVEAVPLTEAARDVLAERHRQIQAEGWTPAHDDEHDSGELAGAGAAYALHAADALHPQSQGDAYRDGSIPHGWCWEDCWWKPTDPRRSLVKAGALILAELERMDRGIAPKAAQEKT